MVAVLAERSAELVTALVGVVKAGAAFLPLDPEYPPERLAYMLADSGAQIVLAQRHIGDLLPESGPPVLYLDETHRPGQCVPPTAADQSCTWTTPLT